MSGKNWYSGSPQCQPTHRGHDEVPQGNQVNVRLRRTPATAHAVPSQTGRHAERRDAPAGDHDRQSPRSRQKRKNNQPAFGPVFLRAKTQLTYQLRHQLMGRHHRLIYPK
jgi:hypothetical protein